MPSITLQDRVEKCELGVAILSQTCDVVLSDRPNLIVGKVVQLAGNDARAGKEGERPRWVYLPGVPENRFVDLEYVATISKDSVGGLSYERGLGDDSWRDQRKFALAVGRRFSRVALPDEVAYWFAPLVDEIKTKYDRPASPLFRALEAVRQFRIEVTSESWQPPGLEIILHVILKSGHLPVLGDEVLETPAALSAWLRAGRSPSEIAERLFPNEGRVPDLERDVLWRAFGAALAAKAKPVAKARALPGVVEAVAAIVSSVVGEEDFNLRQWRHSDELDLAHLSAPLPHEAADDAE